MAVVAEAEVAVADEADSEAAEVALAEDAGVGAASAEDAGVGAGASLRSEEVEVGEDLEEEEVCTFLDFTNFKVLVDNFSGDQIYA